MLKDFANNNVGASPGNMSVFNSAWNGEGELADRLPTLLVDRDGSGMTIGRLIVWSNDILIRLAGDGFAHMQHLSQFYWETKDREI